MGTVVPVSIPRWQWRTFDTDLSWLTRRLSAQRTGPIQWAEETHLLCAHSAHHAWVKGDTLELRWRKEVDPDGFELWDTILRATAPFRWDDLTGLYAAWGLPAPGSNGHDGTSVVTLDQMSETPSVQPVRVTRSGQNVFVHGITCTLESVAAGVDAHVQSFSIEHEDPSIIGQLLSDLGVGSRVNTSFLQGLKQILGLTESQQHER